MYAASTVSTLVGLPLETISEWQEKYRIIPTPGPVRPGTRFPDDAVRLVAAAAHLVDLGWHPADALSEVRRRMSTGSGLFLPDTPLAPPTVASLDQLTRAAIEHAAANRVARVRHTVREAWARFGPHQVADAWVMPTLRVVGTAWECGDLTAAAEHLISHEIRAALTRDLDYALGRHRAATPTLLVGTAPGVHHDMGALALAALAARRRDGVIFLGGDATPQAWDTALAAGTPTAAVLTATTLADVRPTASFFAWLREGRPDLRFFVGGRHETELKALAAPLGPELGRAARTVTGPMTLGTVPAPGTVPTVAHPGPPRQNGSPFRGGPRQLPLHDGRRSAARGG